MFQFTAGVHALDKNKASNIKYHAFYSIAIKCKTLVDWTTHREG